MKTLCGVAHSDSNNSYQAGRYMSEQAMARAGAETCNFAFVFASAEHDSKEIIRGVRSVIGNHANIVGGTAGGIITNDFIGYESFISGIMVISSEDISFSTSVAEGLTEDEYLTGVKSGRQIAAMLDTVNPNLMLFYDSVKPEIKDGIPYYQATPILKGIESEIKKWPPTAGVGIATTIAIEKTEVWNNEQIISDAIISLVISGKVRMDTTIMHGCRPASDYHKITKTKANLILELDGKPATKLVEEYLGNPAEIDWKSAMFFITLGVNKGDKYGPFKEEFYVNRLVMGIDEKTGGLAMMEGDLKKGDEFQFMRRCIETDMVDKGTKELLSSLNGRKPLFAFYISCIGRMKRLFGSEKEEASEVQHALGPDIPLLGIYSGVEIAKVNNKIMPLDWTGVLCIFSEP